MARSRSREAQPTAYLEREYRVPGDVGGGRGRKPADPAAPSRVGSANPTPIARTVSSRAGDKEPMPVNAAGDAARMLAEMSDGQARSFVLSARAVRHLLAVVDLVDAMSPADDAPDIDALDAMARVATVAQAELHDADDAQTAWVLALAAVVIGDMAERDELEEFRGIAALVTSLEKVSGAAGLPDVEDLVRQARDMVREDPGP